LDLFLIWLYYCKFKDTSSR